MPGDDSEEVDDCPNDDEEEKEELELAELVLERPSDELEVGEDSDSSGEDWEVDDSESPGDDSEVSECPCDESEDPE